MFLPQSVPSFSLRGENLAESFDDSIYYKILEET